MCCSEQGGPGAARLGGLQGDEGLLLLCLELQTVLVLYCRKIRASCFVLFVIDTKLKEIMSKGTSRRRRRSTSRSSSSPSPRYSSPPARASPTVSGRGVASGRSAEPEQVGPGRTGGAVRGTARRRSHNTPATITVPVQSVSRKMLLYNFSDIGRKEIEILQNFSNKYCFLYFFM